MSNGMSSEEYMNEKLIQLCDRAEAQFCDAIKTLPDAFVRVDTTRRGSLRLTVQVTSEADDLFAWRQARELGWGLFSRLGSSFGFQALCTQGFMLKNLNSKENTDKTEKA